MTTELDTRAPESQAAGPDQSRRTTWTITYTAFDETSGVAAVELYARGPGETGYVLVATDDAAQDGRFEYTGTIDGTYRFRTIATDRAGNAEATPGTPDAVTELDTRAPVLEQAMGRTPVRLDLGEDRPFRLRFRVDEAVSATFRVTRAGNQVRTFGEQDGGPGLLEQLWRGLDDRGRQVGPGRYRLVVTAVDAAENRSVAAVPLRLVR